MTSFIPVYYILLLAVQYIKSDFELTVLHTNDVHARVEQFTKYGGTCQSTDSTDCFGGVARRQTVVDEIRKNETNVILLDGGDEFQGTLWFNVYKGQAAARFMNYTKYDAMAIGNHEFDNGPSGLISFMRSANFSVLSSNIDTSAETTWPNNLPIKKSVVLERNGKLIGIIGYTTQDTAWLSKPGGNIKFHDVIETVRSEAVRLKKAGVNILIALGHAGIETDKMVAQSVNEIDIVVGGHSNTFLYNGIVPSNDKSEGSYPLHFTHKDGSKVVVVQDFTYGKYLGNLKVVFNDAGQIISWSGNPILLDSSFEQDGKVLKIVKEMDDPILKQRNVTIGRSLVHLVGDRRICRVKECNFGNFIADAVVRMAQQTPDEKQWATVALGLMNSGGIRASIDRNVTERITSEELNAVLPFGNTADIIQIKGVDLLAAFEHSVSGVPIPEGRFLQVSGFQVKYDIKKPVSSRVVEIKVLCIECRVPQYELLNKTKTYKVITTSYLIGGGDGFEMFKNALTHHPGDVTFAVVQQYLRKESPIAPAVEGRITFVEKSNNCKLSDASHVIGQFTFLLLASVISLLHYII